MNKILVLSFICFLSLSASQHTELPDLRNKAHLKVLGIGKIFEKDNSIITRITLEEVSDHGIVYIKDESLHDIAKDKIARIEFYKSHWGSIKITFRNDKTQISLIND